MTYYYDTIMNLSVMGEPIFRSDLAGRHNGCHNRMMNCKFDCDVNTNVKESDWKIDIH